MVVRPQARNFNAIFYTGVDCFGLAIASLQHSGRWLLQALSFILNTSYFKCWVSFPKRHLLQWGEPPQRSGSPTYVHDL
ncbi:hypothetical protein [Scytonema sp. NUACC21]